MSNILGTDYIPDYTPTQDEKNIAMLSHLLTFIAPIIAPLIIYVLKKNESPFIEAHAKESLNFHLTATLFFIVSIILIIVLVGILLLCVIGLATTVLAIVATIRASEGRIYQYPFTIRFVK
ncbi:MAG: DUF4870 domain-containing protein [Sphingobacteriia bacterium]|nr:DUF4870 domain-containing protein [Sphingobacteriia bacterium]